MAAKIFSTIELTGVEKGFCLHGSWVKICHAAHLSGNQSTIVNNIPYVIPHLLKRHPRMRSRLRIHGYHHLLEVLDYDEHNFAPNLFYSIKEVSDQSWQEVADEECHRNPYTDKVQTVFPLFHFILLLAEKSQSSNEDLFHLLLFSNHCAADGQSGFILINDFLTLVTSLDLANHIEPVNREIIPCINQFVPRPYGFLNPIISYIAKCIFKRELRQLQHPRIPVKTTFLDGGSTSLLLQPVKLHFVFASTSTTLHSRLREKCQSEHVTLHGPLFACLLLAIEHCFPRKNRRKRYLYPSMVDLDFNMRSRLPQSPWTPSTVGYCVSMCSIGLKKRLSLTSTRFWTLARNCISITNKVLSNGELYLTEHIANDIVMNERIFNKFARLSPNGCLSEVNFSNIGKYPYSCGYGSGQLRLQGLHIINNGGIYHTSSILLITCAGDGQLDISLAHEMESKERGQEFLDYYIQLVEKCADADMEITLQQLLNSD